MLQSFLNKIWVIILLYGGWEIWVAYEAHRENLESISNTIPTITAQISRAKKEKRQIKSYLRDIEEAKKNIELVAQEVEKLQRKLPETIQDTENLSFIKSIAEGLNIKKIFLSPGTEENKGFYFIKKYEFSATGTFLQFLIFLEKIGSSERLLNVKQVDIKKSEEKQRGRFQLSNARIIVEAYRFNPDHKEDRGIDKLEEGFKEQQKTQRINARKKRKKGKEN